MQLLHWLHCPTELSSVAFEGGAGCGLEASLGSEFGPWVVQREQAASFFLFVLLYP